MGLIELNSQLYVLEQDRNGQDLIRQGYVQRQTQPFRLQGVQSRQDDASVNRFIHRSFFQGLGWSRQDRETGRGVEGMRDATVDTGFSQVTLGRLQEQHTHSSPADHFRKAVNFSGDLWALFEEEYVNSAVTDIAARSFDAANDDWTGGGNVASASNNSNGMRGFDLWVSKGALWVLHNISTGVSGEISTSSDGASWSTASGTGWTADSLASAGDLQDNAHDLDRAKGLAFGDNNLAATFDTSNSEIRVQNTTDDGSNWSSIVTIASGDGPKAFVDWYDLSVTRSPVLVAGEAIYAIDISNTTFETIYTLDGNSDTGRWAEVGNDGALYVGLSSGKILRLAITDTNRLEVITVGPPGDGLVSARQGHANYILKTPSEWLLVAYGGHASGDNASIFKIDTSVILTDPETGKKFMPWHHVYQHSSANLDIVALAYSTQDDGTPRLHFAVEGSSASDVNHIENPLEDPSGGATIKYQSSSVLRLPTDGLGDPQTTSTVYQALVSADGLTSGTNGSGTSSDEYIQVQYGLDGNADTTNDLGDFLLGQTTLTFGSSSEGDSGNKIATRLTFNQSSSNTKTPKLDEFELQASSRLLGRRYWEFTINIEETAKVQAPSKTAGTPIQETIISNLETVAESTTMVTFTAGQMTQTRVEVPNSAPPVFNLQVAGSQSATGHKGFRTGTVTMRVEEGV